MIDSQRLRFIQQLGRSYRAFVAGFEAHTGQSMARWRILVLLDRHGEMSQKQLVGELAIDPAALTRQLKALEKSNMVKRHSARHDARLTNVELTATGRRLVASTMSRRNQYIEHALGGLQDAEIEQVVDVLARLEASLNDRTALL